MPTLRDEIDVLIEPDSGVVPDDPVLRQAASLFARDYARLSFDHPRYYSVLAILTKYWTHCLPTLAVGLSKAGVHQLWINPVFYRKITRQEHRVAVLMHEIHHIVLGHCVANEWPQHLLAQQAVFTVACELAANTHVSLPLPTRPIRPIVPSQYGLPERLTTMQYFKRLAKSRKLKTRVQAAARRLRRNDAGRIPEVASGRASGAPKETDLSVLRAAAEVGEDERDVVASLSRDRLRAEPSPEGSEPPPEVNAVEGYETPSAEWQAEHCITIDGDIKDSHVFARILNVLLEDTTRGYSLGGSFRSRTFKRPNRRQADAFGCPGVRKTGGGPAMELDLCFVVDATSSMSPYIRNTANSLFWIVNRLSHWQSINWRVALSWYRDCRCDADYFRQYPFTTTIARVKQHLENLRADGGGDEPESAAFALYHAARRDNVTFDHPNVRKVDLWRPSAKKRVVFLVTDATCHGRDGDISVQDAVWAALAADVHVYILGPWTWRPYQQMAQMTKGKLFRVEHLVAPTTA